MIDESTIERALQLRDLTLWRHIQTPELLAQHLPMIKDLEQLLAELKGVHHDDRKTGTS